MKNQNSKLKTNLLAAALLFTAALHLHAQGSLTPPAGAPAPVMKSLDQVEARIPLVAGQPGVSVGASGAITISQPGSYYLTTNLTITAANVHGIDVGNQTATIDLNGFTITMTNTANSGAVAAVYINGTTTGQQVFVRNGHITGGGTNLTCIHGVYQNGSVARTSVENVNCYRVKTGIYLTTLNLSGEGLCVVRNCSTDTTGAGIATGASGIQAQLVIGCTVQRAGGYGIIARLATDCVVDQGSGSSGNAINSTTANGCMVIAGTSTIVNKYNMP